MSGTSLDGIDVAIIDITGSGFKAKINVLTSHSVPYPKSVREALLAMSNASTITGDISRLNFLLGELYAEALEEAAERGQIPLNTIKLIGCHGQTIYHEGSGDLPNTLQIGEAAIIAERVGAPRSCGTTGTGPSTSYPLRSQAMYLESSATPTAGWIRSCSS